MHVCSARTQPLAGNRPATSCYARSDSSGALFGARVLLRKQSHLQEIKGFRFIGCYSITVAEVSLWFVMIMVAMIIIVMIIIIIMIIISSSLFPS